MRAFNPLAAAQSTKEKVTHPMGSTGLSPYHLTWLLIPAACRKNMNQNNKGYLFERFNMIEPRLSPSHSQNPCTTPKAPRPSLQSNLLGVGKPFLAEKVFRLPADAESGDWLVLGKGHTWSYNPNCWCSALLLESSLNSSPSSSHPVCFFHGCRSESSELQEGKQDAP